MPALANGSYAGVAPPILMPGKILLPPHMRFGNGETMTTTAGRYYVVPFFVARTTTFAGVKFRNSGAGDIGDLVKIAFYGEAAAGGPGALAKDFGISTLGGAAAINTLVSAWTAVGPAWYYGVIVSNNTCDLNVMFPGAYYSSAGLLPLVPEATRLGAFATDLFAALGSTTYQGDYVAGTYANFPEATALAPTNSLLGAVTLASTGFIPGFGPYA